MADISRHDFVFLFEVTHGNPNGDPDAGDFPRLDPDTGRGLVTDVALKRRIRNYVALSRGEVPGCDIYVRERAVLNRAHARAYAALGLDPEPRRLPREDDQARALTRWMCRNFYDVRAFGAVMTTEINCGQVRGPVQLTFAQSIDPVSPAEITLTRSSVTNEVDARTTERTMGRKYIIPYGLYRAHGFVSAPLANDPVKGTGFSLDDLELLWEALAGMFEQDRSAGRGQMSARALICFRHESALGNAPAHRLFSRVTVHRATGGVGPARAFEDYEVLVDAFDLPAGVTVQRYI